MGILKEIQDICLEHNECYGCPFENRLENGICAFREPPAYWNIKEDS